VVFEPSGYLVPRPQFPELLALPLQGVHHLAGTGVRTGQAVGRAQARDLGTALPRLVGEEIAGTVGGGVSEPAVDGTAGQTGVSGVITEEGDGESVLHQGLAEAGEDQRRGVVEPVEHPLQRWGDVGVERATLRRSVAGKPEEMVAFVDAQPESTSQRGKHLRRGLRPACLLESDVVVRRHGGQRCHLFAAKSAGTSTRSATEPDVLGVQVVATAVQEIGELGTVHAPIMRAWATPNQGLGILRQPVLFRVPLPAGTVEGDADEGTTVKISGNTIFIPGSTSGIGLALALRLQRAGNTVIIGGRRPEALEQVAVAHPELATVIIDVTDPASILTARDQVLADHPELDVVITMAGVMIAEDYRSSAFLETAEQIVTTNLLGTLRLVSAFTEHLQARPAATLMTVSSGLAHIPLALTPTYNATKAAVHLLSESIRLQFADTSVQIVELVPPAVRTELMPGQSNAAYAIPLDEYVDEVMSLIESQPEAAELLVERVKTLRYAEVRGEYEQVAGALNAAH
jgi:uncharacterized oxidoreductase